MNSRHFCYVLAAFSAFCIFAGKARAAEPAAPGTVSCVPIRTAAQLQKMNLNLGGSFCLANDIDASSIANFVPVGDNINPFTGKLTGNGHVIRNLTIDNASKQHVGLFGFINGAEIRDAGLINVKIAGSAASGRVGGFVGHADGAGISRVFVTGSVSCSGLQCHTGGIGGELFTTTVDRSWSSATVVGHILAGGAVAALDGATSSISRSYATGSVKNVENNGSVGGLVGAIFNGATVRNSFAVGAAKVAPGGFAGGLTGLITGSVVESFATGPVTGGSGAVVGGLVSKTVSPASIAQSYSAGRVTGTATGGLFAASSGGAPTVTNAYWDTSTSGQALSAGGTGMTTSQLRAALPAGFDNSWAISQKLSYPFLDDSEIDFASPLATLALSDKIYAFLPLGQLDESLYGGPTNHIDGASLATVYTMLARAIGETLDINTMKRTKINKFWNDKNQTTKFAGPVTDHVTLGAFKDIAASKPIAGNVTGPMNHHKLVILRGSFTKDGGGKGTHYLLGTMYTKDAFGKLLTVVANDPWTGTQVSIDPTTKEVFSPAGFPLSNFQVDGFQTATID